MIFSLDLKKRVIATVDEGMRIDKVVKIFQVSRRVIYKWLELRRKTGSLSTKTGYQKGHSHKITDWEQFKKFTDSNRHCSAPQMIIKWKKLTNVGMSESVMLRVLKKIGFTSKKKFLIIPKPMQKSGTIFRKNEKY